MWNQFLFGIIKLSPSESGLPTSTPDLSVALVNGIRMLFAVIGALAVIFMIVGAIQISTSAGSPMRLKQGRETVLYSIVGLMVSLSAFAIVWFIGGRL